MNIIESALLKSVGGNTNKSDSKDKKVASAEKPSEVVTKSQTSKTASAIEKSQSGDERQLVSGRKSIKNMHQPQAFSARELDRKGIVSIASSDNQLLNEYRNLRTKLLNGSHGRNFSTAVTSVSPEHDINNVSLNLAATFALDSGKTSVLLNANFEGSEIDNKLEAPIDLGVVDLIEDDSLTMEDVLQQTRIHRLRYIPFGQATEGSAEFFSSERMADIIHLLVSRYADRYPIVNAPSIATSADTRILMNLCDKIVLVVPYGKSSEIEIKQAMLSIDKSKFAGVILDGF